MGEGVVNVGDNAVDMVNDMSRDCSGGGYGRGK